jgi:spore coat polysaccharide biosynthesis protein SpsF
VEALRDPDVQAIQLPFNILDHRWQAAGVDRLAMQRGDVAISVRSVFLQGILAAPASVWPQIPDVHPDQILTRLDEVAHCLGRADRVDLCLAYVRAQPWVHHIVIGVETPDQLRDLVQRFQESALSFAATDTVRQFIPILPESLLNPALWPH